MFWTVAFAAMAAPRGVDAHSASDAYLTLTADEAGTEGKAATDGKAGTAGKVVLHGQWDIALRDLDFVLKLDDDGDGRLTWQEVRRHQAAIAQYAYRYLRLAAARADECVIEPRRQLIDDHADGAYVALFFDAVCPHMPQKVTLNYSLFFNIDPSHRGIFVMHSGGSIATALLSPDNARIDLSF